VVVVGSGAVRPGRRRLFNPATQASSSSDKLEIQQDLKTAGTGCRRDEQRGHGSIFKN
jgi:hypothetical protein